MEEAGTQTAVALASALHPRLGAGSPASLLPQHLVRDVLALLVPLPEPSASLLLAAADGPAPSVPALCALAKSAPVAALLAVGHLLASSSPGSEGLLASARALMLGDALGRALAVRWERAFGSSRRAVAGHAVAVARRLGDLREALADTYLHVAIADCGVAQGADGRELVLALCEALDKGDSSVSPCALDLLDLVVSSTADRSLAPYADDVAHCLLRCVCATSGHCAYLADCALLHRPALDLLRRLLPRMPPASPAAPQVVRALLAVGGLWFHGGRSVEFFWWLWRCFPADLAPYLDSLAAAALRLASATHDGAVLRGVLDLVRAVAEADGAHVASLVARPAETFESLRACAVRRAAADGVAEAWVGCLSALAACSAGLADECLLCFSRAFASSSAQPPDLVAAALSLRALCRGRRHRALLRSAELFGLLARGCASREPAVSSACLAAAPELAEAAEWLPVGPQLRALVRAARHRLADTRGSEAALGAVFRVAARLGSDAADTFVAERAGGAVDRMLRALAGPALDAGRRDSVLGAVGDVVSVCPPVVACRRAARIVRALRGAPVEGSGAAHCLLCVVAAQLDERSNANEVLGADLVEEFAEKRALSNEYCENAGRISRIQSLLRARNAQSLK
eukprot:m51a1_g9812 hypothetical protein (633) ;mRNA; r:1854270-1856623